MIVFQKLDSSEERAGLVLFSHWLLIQTAGVSGLELGLKREVTAASQLLNEEEMELNILFSTSDSERWPAFIKPV